MQKTNKGSSPQARVASTAFVTRASSLREASTHLELFRFRLEKISSEEFGLLIAVGDVKGLH